MRKVSRLISVLKGSLQLAILGGALSIVCAAEGFAQSGPGGGAAEDPPALPLAATNTIAAQPIGVAQLQQFRKLLLPELLPLVRAGVIELEALARTRFEWSLRVAVEDAPVSASSVERALGAAGELPSPYRSELAPLFDGKDKSGAWNPSEMLWNATAARWGFPVQSAAQTVSWYKQGKFQRELRIKSARIYPAKLQGVTAGTQLFRDRFSVQAPTVLQGLSLLTYRFLGADEDLIWAYSPAIAKARQLAGASHSDSILEMPYSLSDCALWSGKHELVEPSLQLTQEALVPVAGVDLLSAAPGVSGCFEQQEMNTRAGSDLAPRWATEGRSPWGIFSALSYFVPRKVVRIELESRDPFSEYGRQVLTVDQELQVPLMKLVYDRSGHPWKFLMGALGLVQPKGDSRRAVTYPVMLVHDYLKDETLLLSQTAANFCDGFTAAIPATDFDIRTFVGQGAAAPAGDKPTS
ncbi:MAG: DUF1329 domain-containing protein [Proteobacteria bacterium]|nr:DUF1329 domain-containing protein [Pseudomonadota bacterium]